MPGYLERMGQGEQGAGLELFNNCVSLASGKFGDVTNFL